MKARFRDEGRALGRGSLLGVALYLSLTADPHVNLQMNLLSYAVAVIWCAVDEIYARDAWWAPLLEGFVVQLMAVAVGNALIIMAGSPFA